MAVLSLKTELDVAELLLDKGWFPEEINSVLVFPLPRTLFRHLNHINDLPPGTDVTKVTTATPTTIYRARQLLASAGWLDRELDSLLKPHLCGNNAWANQTIHPTMGGLTQRNTPLTKPLSWVNPVSQKSLRLYRRTMALKRIGSLTMVMALVSLAIALLG